MVDFQSRDSRRGSVDGGGTETDPDGRATDTGGDPGDGDVTDAESPAPSDATVGSDGGTSGLGVGLVAVAPDASLSDDPAIGAVAEALEPTDVAVVTREAIAPEFDGVQSTVDALAERDDVDFVVTTGGTEIGPSDVVPEAVEPLFDRTVPGFGELLRGLARDEAGSDALTMRPVAGVVDATPVFSLPGQPWAARLGAAELVAPQAGRVVVQARDGDEEGR